MSRRSYTKGAARGFTSAPRDEEDRGAEFLAARRRGAQWFQVWKDGVKLSYGTNQQEAEKHAARCGGTVVPVGGRKR